MNATKPLDPNGIVQMASAYYASATLFAALELNIFEALHAANGSTAEALAQRLSLSPRGIRMLLDACVGLGLLIKSEQRYTNTPAADICLVPGSQHDLTGAIRYNMDVYQAWGRLSDFVRSGHPVESPDLHLGADPDRTRRFVLAMHSRALGIGRAVIPMLDLQGACKLLDLAGGSGAYSVLMAQSVSGLICTVLDLPPVVNVAKTLVAESAVSERVRFLPGDYHATPYPAQIDVVTIFGALHQETPEQIVDILQRAYAALRPGGQIYILDLMTDSTRTQPVFSTLFALNMAMTTEHGWVFSEADIVEWLTQAGFVGCNIRPVPPPMPHRLACAKKPV